ncbi:energy transducer TonB [Flavobacterium procerum]|uniref:Energy transducer TonB n=1 Tax=Flavobacterium procerum TaxID=1455569 RepID=A0ABV6BWJ5_9FLAO
MESKYKITIPKPCKKDWNQMTPTGDGRFCMNCSKTVIDFSVMLPEEIQHFFIQNQNERICGRFKDSQLQTIQIQIPSQVLYMQTKYHKMFLLALFIAMGTTLFSCADKDGNKNKIDKIEIVDNIGQIQDDEEVVSSCYGHQIESKKPKKERDERITMGIVLSPPRFDERGSFKYDIIYNQNDLDVLPVPENGMKKFYDFFNKNYVAPDKTEKYRGKIFILFVVEEDGSLSNFNPIKDTPKEIGEEAIRILEAAPTWIPGKLKNRAVRSSYTLPITIQ